MPADASGCTRKNKSAECVEGNSPQKSKNKSSSSSSQNKSGERPAFTVTADPKIHTADSKIHTADSKIHTADSKTHTADPKTSARAGSASKKAARKRKRREISETSESDLESELDECNLEDAIALERKLRKVAKNNSLNDEEMKKLLQKFVKNEHVLALVTLKAEDEIARERREMDKRTYALTVTPSVPKLTRAKARELNKTPAISLPALNEPPPPEIAALIKEELHSDEDDEEYIFKEEDFASDDDPSTTVSDFDSNPCTPQTPYTQTEHEDSPVKLTSDGCFKIPMDKREQTQENMRIATRTRSKLCLQQTTIEDIQSEFVPPDVDINEIHDIDATANDEDWMQFLNDFSKPLSNSLLGDDDDPVNDPEYIAADKERVDAEELRDVNISKKELTELVAELFEGLVNEGISLESVDLETPQKFLETSMQTHLDKQQQLTPTTALTTGNSRFGEVSRQINFDGGEHGQQTCVSDATITSTNLAQHECSSFQPDVMSTPGFENNSNTHNATLIPVAVATTRNESNPKTISIPDATNAPELIAIPVPGHPNQFHLARVLATEDTTLYNTDIVLPSTDDACDQTQDKRYSVPYDNNFTWQYISIRRHVYSEYMEKFENLRNVPEVIDNLPKDITDKRGITADQHDILQQQLRIHVQMLTQTYIQTYSHPEFWKMAPQVRSMLDELHEKAATHASFNAWNLKKAIDLINHWEEELSVDTPENKEMMAFLHKEVELTNRNTRQIPRFAPRIMDFMLQSDVFMYPTYLPRIPFTPRVASYHIFSPSESLLIALGLDKHMKKIKERKYNISKKVNPLVVACNHTHKDTIFGKTKRRIWDQVKKLRKASYYNPVKYYFEHNCAPPVEHQLITFENNTVLPPIQRINELPLAWRNYVQKKNQPQQVQKNLKNTNNTRNKAAAATANDSNATNNNFLDLVREVVGENIQLPECLNDTTEPEQTSNSTCDPNNSKQSKKGKRKRTPKRANNVTINVNYVFGAGTNQIGGGSGGGSDVSSFINTTTTATCTPPGGATTTAQPQSQSQQTHHHIQPSRSNIIAYNYDFNLQQLEPVIATSSISAESNNDLENSIIDQTTEATESLSKPPTPIKLSSRKIQYRPRPRPPRPPRLYSFHGIKRFGVSKKRHRAVSVHRRRSLIKTHFLQLFTAYKHHLQQQELSYRRSPIVLHYYKYFKALELYTSFLHDLKMFCRNEAQTGTSTSAINSNIMASSSSGSSSSSSSSKRVRTEDETCQNTSSTARSRKVTRQEEHLRNMLLPDSAEDANRKDAIYAFNFYEKVEEVFKNANRPDDYEKFNSILKSFNPKSDRAADLYRKLEALFLPDYPELAQVFLAFLLPSEAAEIGKFFEHFMITNMTTFINKLNVYFNKQPAQIRKIFNCLSDLAEDTDVTMKKVEEKILPLLKGNQFLVDWFMQQFPGSPVPERLIPTPEHVNLKEVQNNKDGGEFMETMKDIMNSPNTDQQPPPCQLRYVNGRIFYGSKMTLPAKLTFMAKSYTLNELNDGPAVAGGGGAIHNSSGCVHGVKEYGEKLLAAAAASNSSTSHTNASNATTLRNEVAAIECTTDKSEEDELSKDLIIDTTATDADNDSCSSFEVCDETALRYHALRLNPSYYGNTTCFSSVASSTPNNWSSSHHQTHHPNAKKQSLNFNEDIKMSPRKMGANNSLGVTPLAPDNSASSSNSTTSQHRERRKSPVKKIKSPNTATKSRVQQQQQQQQQHQPMVVIHREPNTGPIVYAKKLKTLIESADEQTTTSAAAATAAAATDHPSDKLNVPIIARVKQRPPPPTTFSSALDNSHSRIIRADSDNDNSYFPGKYENSDDMEFLPEHTPPHKKHAYKKMVAFPKFDLNTDSSTEECKSNEGVLQKSNRFHPNFQTYNVDVDDVGVSSTNVVDSDEDCKLDIVATLATTVSEEGGGDHQTDKRLTTAIEATPPPTTTTSSCSQFPLPIAASAFTRNEDKVILIEMKIGSSDRDDLLERIKAKLPNRTINEISARHEFLMDFLSKLQGKPSS